ncbi:uncharacterized protein LOC121381177 [Gigantopelta aegis]|uniref:uncharacterized protein LOC121381177 n=1 Tax=Gigantopelta aegis TaxID=1735272 RepID=UPI001B88BB77|nr:uncharacterized protein LOC121381177 [Gigantopelta aegis]
MSVVFRSLLKVPNLVTNKSTTCSNGLKLIVNRLVVAGPQLHTSAAHYTPIVSTTLSSSATKCSNGRVSCSQTSSNTTCTCNCSYREQIMWADVCVQSVRTHMRKHYDPSAWKRINKHGIEQRLRSETGIHILWRRMLKKRFNLAPFERVLQGTVNGKILPKHQIPKVPQKDLERILKRK